MKTIFKEKRKYKLVSLIALSSIVISILLSSCGAIDGKNDIGFDVDASEDMKAEEVIDKNEGSPSEMSPDMNFSSTNPGSENYEPKIIKTVTIHAETESFTEAVSEIEKSLALAGGYIEICNVYNKSSATASVLKNASYTLRIPVENLDSFLSDAGKLLNIVSNNSSATDVSSDYYDIEARLSVLETERAVLEKMLSESESVSEMIEIEKRLYDVIYEIESNKTSLKVYDSKVAYSTVHLYLNEVATLTPVAEDNSFGTRFKNAVSESFNGFVDFCKDTVIFLVYASPAIIVMSVILLAVAVIALIVVRIIVSSLKRRRKTRISEIDGN